MGISLLLVRRTAIPIIILLAWIQLNIMFDHQQFMRLVRFHEEEEDALLQDHKGETKTAEEEEKAVVGKEASTGSMPGDSSIFHTGGSRSSQEETSVEVTSERRLDALLKGRSSRKLSLPSLVCRGLDCCTTADNGAEGNLCPNIQWILGNGAEQVRWHPVPPTFVHRDPAHAVAVTLGQVTRSYVTGSENEIRLASWLSFLPTQTNCTESFWKMVFRTVEFMGTQGETCDSPDEILARVNALYTSKFHYPPDKTGPVRRYWMMMLSFTPMEHRPQMVLMIEAEASYAHPGSDVAPHRIELVRRLYYTGGLQPRKEIVSSSLHMIRKPPVVNILLANYQSGVMLEQFVDLLRMYYRCSGDRYFRLVVVDASPSYFGVEDILERSQIPYRLVVVKPPFLRAGLLNMAANATYTPMRLDVSSPNIISTTISANDVKDDDDSILLMFDLSITYPMEWLWRIRGLVVKGLRLYAPEVFRTRYGAPARVSLSEAEGKTETEGYGILAVHRDDFERYYFDADKFKHKWGGEDVDLVGRMVVTDRKIGIVRTRGEHVVHIWHPPFNNTKWYETFKPSGGNVDMPHHMKCDSLTTLLTAGKVRHEAASAFYDSMPPQCQLQTERPRYALSMCDDQIPRHAPVGR